MACFSSSARDVTSSRRPERGLPPASTASSQLCRRRHRKRRRGNRLTSPPDHAGAAQADRSDKSDLCKESGPRAKRHWRHEQRGRGYGGSGGPAGAASPRPESRADSDSCPLVAILASAPFFAVFRAFSSNTSRTGEAKTPGSCPGRGPRAARSHAERLPHAASRCLLRTRCLPDPLRIPSIPSPPSRSLGLPGKPYPLLLPSPHLSLAFFIPRALWVSCKTRGRQLFRMESASQCGAFTGLGLLRSASLSI